jgi:hypothetical protein
MKSPALLSAPPPTPAAMNFVFSFRSAEGYTSASGGVEVGANLTLMQQGAYLCHTSAFAGSNVKSADDSGGSQGHVVVMRDGGSIEVERNSLRIKFVPKQELLEVEVSGLQVQ